MRLFNINTGTEIRGFGTPYVGNVAISPDGRYALASHHTADCASFYLSPSEETTKLKLWEISTGSEVRTISTFHGFDPYLAFNSDGRSELFLSSAILANNLAGAKWDSQDWNVIQSFQTENFFDSSPSAPSSDTIDGSPALSRDGRNFLLAVSHPMEEYRYAHLILCETATGRQVMQSKSKKETVCFLSFSPDGQSALVSASSYTYIDEIGSQTKTSRLELWDFKSDETSELFSTDGNAAGPVVFSPDGRYAVGSFGSKIVVVEIASKRVVRLLEGSYAGCMQISPDGRYLLTANGSSLQENINNEMILWKLWDGERTGP